MKPKPAGLLLGLAGNLVLGWGIYNVLGTGSCGGEYPPCPASSAPHILALPLGMVTSMLAIFLGGGPVAFLGMFAAVGAASILRGANGGEGDGTFALVFGAFFLLPVLLPLFLIPYGKRRARRAERLVAEGKRAIATVTAIEDTGVTINNNPRVRLTLSIQPEDGGPAFDGEKAMVVPRVDIPRVGDRYPVWYDPQDPTTFGIGTGVQADAPADVRALFVKAGAPAPLPPPEPAPSGAKNWVTELGRLNDLRMSGALTDEEFARAKDKLLAGSPREPAAG